MASLSLTDTHAHLADPAIEPRVDDVVRAAGEAGVERILAVGTDLATSASCVRLAARFPAVFAAVGIHPHDAARFEASTVSELRQLAAEPKVVAIGEIGLDYVRATVTPELQAIVFSEQVNLAAELGLPIVVHNREADREVLRIITGVKRCSALTNRAGVLHCFTGTLDLARQGNAAGFSIGFAGNLTYRRATDLRVVAAGVPLGWVLTETDCPYLSPEPLRGRTNEPRNVGLVARHIASLRDMSVEDVARETSANAARLFDWN